MSWRHYVLIPSFSFCICSVAHCATVRPRRPLPALPSDVRHLGDLAPDREDQDDINPTPEPASLVLFGSGFLILGGALRRYNKKKVDQQAQSKPSGLIPFPLSVCEQRTQSMDLGALAPGAFPGSESFCQRSEDERLRDAN